MCLKLCTKRALGFFHFQGNDDATLHISHWIEGMAKI